MRRRTANLSHHGSDLYSPAFGHVMSISGSGTGRWKLWNTSTFQTRVSLEIPTIIRWREPDTHMGTEIIKPCLTPLFHRIDCHTFVAAFSMTSLQISPPPPDVSVDNINGRPASLLVLTRGTSGNSPITFTPSISAVERNMSGEPKSG